MKQEKENEIETEAPEIKVKRNKTAANNVDV